MQTRQIKMLDSFCAIALEEAQFSLDKDVYFTRGSLAMVNHNEGKIQWKKIGEHGLGFTPPTYHHMQNQLLNN